MEFWKHARQGILQSPLFLNKAEYGTFCFLLLNALFSSPDILTRVLHFFLFTKSILFLFHPKCISFLFNTDHPYASIPCPSNPVLPPPPYTATHHRRTSFAHISFEPSRSLSTRLLLLHAASRPLSEV